jgi:hypothetical protein
MRDSYQDSPAQARDAGLRRLSKLTWRTTQIGALATVGFAVVFARNAPAKTANVQTTTSAKPVPAARATVPGAAQHHSKPSRATSSPVATRPAAAQPTAQPAAQPAAPAAQPGAQPSAAPTTPRLTPPASPPAPAPTSAAPAPTTSSASHGGG